MNRVIVELHKRGMTLLIRDGRLRIDGARSEEEVNDLLPTLRARRVAFERRTLWAYGAEQRCVWSALRGERIAVGYVFGQQRCEHVRRGDPVQYDTVELALIAGLSRQQILFIHAVKRTLGGVVMVERRRYERR